MNQGRGGSMIEITPTKLRDFGLCRYLYEQKHIEGVPEKITLPERDQLVYEFEDSLQTAIKWFYFEAMADKVPSYKALMWKWEKLWFKNVTAEDIMRASDYPGKNRNSYNTDAATILAKFHNTHQRMGKVLMINENYEVPITRNAKAVGNLDLVILVANQIVITHFSTRSKGSYARGTEGSFKVILDSLAFRHKADRIENKITIDLVRTGKTFDTVVTDVDIENVKRLSDEMNNCTNFYPSNGCYWCDNGCQFKTECWTGK
jgi:hypothetical protein